MKQSPVEENYDAAHWNDTVIHGGEEKVQEKSDVLEDGDAKGKTIEDDEYPDQDDIKGKELTWHVIHVGAESLKVGVSGRGFEELSITDSEDIDKETFKNPVHWNNTSSEDAVTSASVNVVSIMSGSFEQDTCPDYSALFDLVNAFIANLAKAPLIDYH
ncbi:hypothetical protein NOF04DRAFT_1281694 [Fusarium oxysporum II5]|nr:hypothetical protein NOF04DRAFT_1281694 [Fusarium oxysporum II5]